MNHQQEPRITVSEYISSISKLHIAFVRYPIILFWVKSSGFIVNCATQTKESLIIKQKMIGDLPLYQYAPKLAESKSGNLKFGFRL